MEIQLGQCSRLRARISEVQCKKNRVQGTFACDGCNGLTGMEPVTYEPSTTVTSGNKLSDVITHNIRSVSEEKTMSKPAVKGTCPTCRRTEITLTQTKAGDCFRCYDRIKKGKDPLTGLPVAAQEATTPPPAATPPILEKMPAPPPPVSGTCHINPVQVMDEVWQKTRTAWVKELSEAPDAITRLRLAANMLEAMNRLAA